MNKFLSLFQQGKDLKTLLRGRVEVGNHHKFLSLFQQGKDLKTRREEDDFQCLQQVSIPFSAGQRLKAKRALMSVIICSLEFLSLFQQGKDLKFVPWDEVTEEEWRGMFLSLFQQGKDLKIQKRR